jgi:hypothetical protein
MRFESYCISLNLHCPQSESAPHRVENPETKCELSSARTGGAMFHASCVTRIARFMCHKEMRRSFPQMKCNASDETGSCQLMHLQLGLQVCHPWQSRGQMERYEPISMFTLFCRRGGAFTSRAHVQEPGEVCDMLRGMKDERMKSRHA